MSNNFSSCEILGMFTRDEHEFEVCATAKATFDEARSRLTVQLDSFIRPVNIRAKEQRLPADWLPRSQTVKETVAHDEISALTKDVFHRWVGKVRQAVPVPIHDN